VPFNATSLIEAESDERINWLRHLETLHQQREKLETRVQYARSLETTRFQELDEARRRFQSAQDRAYELQQNLNKTLEQFLTAGASSDSLTMLDEVMQLQGDALEDESLAGRAVEQFAAAIRGYRQLIDAIESELSEAADEVQGELNELQLLAGSKGHEVSEAKALYEQKLAEPEFTPLRSARHIIARAKLAEHGIAALPLYELLDFAPGIDSESDEAGRVETMLEDAGLLDALVVAPPQVAEADALLAAEGLSDCRLNVEALNHNQGLQDGAQTLHSSLRFDSTLYTDAKANGNIGAAYADWENVAATILMTIRYTSHAHDAVETSCSMDEDGTWTHGLLIGRAGGGTARYIGKATRLRARQRELDALHEQYMKLEEELARLHSQLAYYEQQLAQLQEKQAQLRRVLPNSGIEEIYAELSSARSVLDESRNKYQKARLQTQEARQIYNALLAQVERGSNGIAALASDVRQVQSALMGTVKLKNQARSLQMQLTTLLNTWEEHAKARAAREKAQINQANVSRLYERMHHQFLQAQAEVQELLSVAEVANAEELSERLRLLHEQSETLSVQLDEAKTSYARADERANNAAAQLTETEADLERAEAERTEKQAHFVARLEEYPVAELVEIQQLANSDSYTEAAQRLIAPTGEALRESDIPARKERLEEEYRDAYNALSRTFNREQPLLLEYGPDLDDQGRVHFLNENKSRPVELLEILSERIEMQRLLLGQEERRLFEDFLLQEMAEAIRTHILEAEEWVQQVNSVLSGLPMIGEHYALQWKPPTEYDLAKLGSHLAQHYRLLRKPAQTLTAEETETLMGAFRHEIEAVRMRQQENPDINFMEALEQIFDYREWFHFDVLVTPIGGQRQRLTDRMAGTRSGAEQLFALYVPLFAALAALYRTAAPGAPRLLALDEAFDKVSGANTQRIMEFLVSQDFQWIMTGPQISGTGAKIPACARYLMIHEKGSPVATASASFWSDKQTLNPQAH
jgi:Putative exonuclease SbcCD, C subunit